MRASRRLSPAFVLAMALCLAAVTGTPGVCAQDAATDNGLSIAQAEKRAANLRQGMSVDDVQSLLGKPQQTDLKGDGSAAGQSPKGTLQWSYLWNGTGTHARLRVEFTARPFGDYHVNSWQWTAE